MEEHARRLARLVLLGVLVYLLLAPAIHFVHGVAVWYNKHPLFISLGVTIVVSIVASLLVYSLLPSDVREEADLNTGLLMLVAIAWTMLVVLSLPAVYQFSGERVTAYVEVVEEPLNTTAVRLVPLRTAYAHATSKLTIPTHTIYFDEASVMYRNSTPVYAWVVEPEGLLNALKRDAKGVIVVDGVYPPDVHYIEKEMKWSLHRGRFTWTYMTLARELYIRKPHLEPILNNVIVAPLNNHTTILVPAVDWDRGFFYSMPLLAGYFIVWDNGTIDFVEADRLHDHPVIRALAENGYKAPLIPEKLAREWVELYKWVPGWRAVLYHETFTLRDVGVNPQPYLVSVEGHLWWLFVAEPAGESYAVKYLIYVDAESITPRILVYEPTSTWIGASRILTLVKSEHPEFNWDDFQIEEPIPVVVDGRLYWKVTIVTLDGRGIVSVDLVDAETGSVYSFPVSASDGITPENFKAMIASMTVESDSAGSPAQSVEERIVSILERVRALQDELRALEEELRRLQEELQNATKHAP